MAVLFAALLGIATLLFSYFLYQMAQHNFLCETLNASAVKIQLLGTLIISAMLLVILISFFLSTFVVSRINQIADTAKSIIDTGDLAARIHIDSNWDDLSYLAGTLNSLLARIEYLMQGMRDITDNIAHDLRTPVTRLRGELEKLKNKQLGEEDIQKLVQEADNILNIFNSLLRIANIEKGKRHQLFTDVNIANVLQDAIELYEPVAEENKITINSSLDFSSKMPADRDLLFQMFSNLIDNAIKFSEIAGIIEINCSRDHGVIKVSIADNGIGLAQDEREKIFDRFYRADKSRHTQGSGLGLSMVKAIAQLHKINIELEDNNPGLKIMLEFGR